MPYLQESIECCGIRELNEIEGVPLPEIVYEAYCGQLDDRWPRYPPFVFFSSGKSAGRRLEDYIKTHKLGRTWVSPVKNNPTGSRTLRMWVWMPNWKKSSTAIRLWKAHCKKEGISEV